MTIKPEDAAGKRALVVGDMIVDHYRYLKPTRISPEAPVPICVPEPDEWLPGGAGNVASNLLAMGLGGVEIVSAVGRDWMGVSPYWKNDRLLVPKVSFVVDNDRVTTVKERFLTKRQQMLRVDTQSDGVISQQTGEKILELAMKPLEECDVLVLSDYEHGVMTPYVVMELVRRANEKGKPIVVDSKSKNMSKYSGSTIALPNSVEAEEMLRYDMRHTPEDTAWMLMERMGVEAIAITMGPRGIMLLTADRCKYVTNRKAQYFPAVAAEEVVDVTGAGDTVTAAVAVGLSLGLPYNEIMQFANLAADVVVRKRGVATASLKEIEEASLCYGVAQGESDVDGRGPDSQGDEEHPDGPGGAANDGDAAGTVEGPGGAA